MGGLQYGGVCNGKSVFVFDIALMGVSKIEGSSVITPPLSPHAYFAYSRSSHPSSQAQGSFDIKGLHW